MSTFSAAILMFSLRIHANSGLSLSLHELADAESVKIFILLHVAKSGVWT